MAKGLCFQTAGRFVAGGKIPGSILCHGKVVGTKGEAKGKQFVHAWVEIGDIAIDDESDWTGRREDYYRMGQVCDVKRYTQSQVNHITVRCRHWGPWTDEEEAIREHKERGDPT